MNSGEPVSAYEVFKTAKDLADVKNKLKKQNGSVNKKNAIAKSKVKKLAGARKLKSLSVQVQKNKSNKSQKNGNKVSTNSKPAGKGGKQAMNFINMVENMCNVNPNIQKNAKQKKKTGCEEHLTKQPEMDEDAENETINSVDSGEEGSYTDSNVYSSDYSGVESVSLLDKTAEGEYDSASCMSEDVNEREENLGQAVLATTTKKKKTSEKAQSKTKNVISKAKKGKKSKKAQTNKDGTRKTLPATKPGKAAREKKTKISATTAKLEPLSPPTDVVKLNSIEEGKRAFKWLLNPVTVEDFFSNYWESGVCLIQRHQSNYLGHLISFQSIDQMLLKNHVQFTKNIDITSYKNGIRETLNPEGRALPPLVWGHYAEGCSIRLLNPQTFLSELFSLSTTMQEYFQCLVGANVYLTPPNSQGFAPHYDDIEAFVLQIEGRKRWKLYKPRNTSEILPRFSSKNFTQEEIGNPCFEEVLEPGDVLYFPRGTIHQACTEPGYHSLHITLSVYQKQSFADLFEKMLPLMLQKAIKSNVQLRRGLPLHAWQHAGLAFNGNTTKERDDLTKRVSQLMQKCIHEVPLQDFMDSAMDQMAKKFQREALPPKILPDEKLHTIYGSRNRTSKTGECLCDYDIDERTNVRLLRANILRLLREEDSFRIYFYLDNSKEYCEYDANFIEIEPMEAASVEILIKSYPQYVGVSQLPLSSVDDKVALVTALWQRGLLMMEKPIA